MVGHRGIEPRNTCLSGRPLRPAGSWPAEAERVERSRPRLVRVQAGCSHQSACASMSGEGESRTRKAEAQLLSGQVPSPIGLPLHGGRRRTRISGSCDPHPVSRRGPPPGDFISHERRAENSNPTPKRALVSSEAQAPAWFTLRQVLTFRDDLGKWGLAGGSLTG